MAERGTWKPWALSGPALLVFVTMLLAPLLLPDTPPSFEPQAENVHMPAIAMATTTHHAW